MDSIADESKLLGTADQFILGITSLLPALVRPVNLGPPTFDPQNNAILLHLFLLLSGFSLAIKGVVKYAEKKEEARRPLLSRSLYVVSTSADHWHVRR